MVGLVVGIFLGLMALSDKKSEESDKAILVSTEPLAKIARMVVPNDYRVETIVPAGMHIHDFEPSLHDKGRVEQSSVVFYFGNDLDRWGKNLGIKTPPLSFSSGDPHVWIDPVSVKKIVSAMVSEMKKSHIVVDEKRIENVYNELDQWDNELKELAKQKQKKIFVIHDAFYHLFSRYGFDMVPLLKGDSEEPSLGDVSKMVDSIKKERATVILGDEILDEKVYDTLTRETGVKKCYFSTMEQSTESYEVLMKKNIESLKIALEK